MVLAGLMKTGVSAERLETVVDDLEAILQQRSNRDITSQEIGELVLEQLKDLSEVAYVRFASVYRQFQGISDFVSTLEDAHPEGQVGGCLVPG